MTKEQLVAAVAARLLIPAPRMSTGSTEPREIFEAADDLLGLRLESVRPRTKPELARGVVEASGAAWLPTYESRGGTVTKQGLEAVLRAVEFLLRS